MVGPEPNVLVPTASATFRK